MGNLICSIRLHRFGERKSRRGEENREGEYEKSRIKCEERECAWQKYMFQHITASAIIISFHFGRWERRMAVSATRPRSEYRILLFRGGTSVSQPPTYLIVFLSFGKQQLQIRLFAGFACSLLVAFAGYRQAAERAREWMGHRIRRQFEDERNSNHPRPNNNE